MAMTYTYYRILEMNTVDKVFEVVAKDLHSANMEYLKKHSFDDYDIMAINGQYV